MINPVTNTRRLHCTIIKKIIIFCNSKYISEIGIQAPVIVYLFIVARIHSSRSAHYIILYYYPLRIKLESSSSPPSPTRNYHLFQTICNHSYLLPSSTRPPLLCLWPSFDCKSQELKGTCIQTHSLKE